MKINKKFLIAMLSLASLALITGFVTLAYLIDEESVVNTFTVGEVDISLDETDVDGDNSTKENDYHIVPGHEYVKDPTLTIFDGSEESYVRIMMTVYNASAIQAIIGNEKNDLTDFTDFMGGWDEETWLYEDQIYDENTNTITYEFRYKEIVDGFDENGDAVAEKLPPLFERLSIPDELTPDEFKALYGDETTPDDDFKMVLEGHAIQVAGIHADPDNGLTAEDVAWAAFDEQVQK